MFTGKKSVKITVESNYFCSAVRCGKVVDTLLTTSVGSVSDFAVRNRGCEIDCREIDVKSINI